jgi:hypothetical protein
MCCLVEFALTLGRLEHAVHVEGMTPEVAFDGAL